MFTSKLKTIIVASVVSLGALSAMGGSANAEIRGGIYLSGPGISVGFGDRHYGRRHWNSPRHWDAPRRYNRCRPGKAVHKAKRRGIRRAHIVRVNRRGVLVAGRKWGERVVIGFANRRSCPVRFVRSR